jgi:hypothetical protein
MKLHHDRYGQTSEDYRVDPYNARVPFRPGPRNPDMPTGMGLAALANRQRFVKNYPYSSKRQDGSRASRETSVEFVPGKAHHQERKMMHERSSARPH